MSGKLRGDISGEVEAHIFSKIARMRISDVIKEKVSQTQIENELEDIRNRLNSTNRLLMDVSTLLKEVLKKLGL